MRVISRLIEIDVGIAHKGVHRHAISASTRRKVSMRQDELTWIVIIAEILGKGGAAHSDLDVLADFQMQMRVVQTMGRAHRRDLLAASHCLPTMDQHIV